MAHAAARPTGGEAGPTENPWAQCVQFATMRAAASLGQPSKCGGAHGSAASRVLRGHTANRRGIREGGGRVDRHHYSIRMDISSLFHRGRAAPFANSAKIESVVPAIHRWSNVLLKAWPSGSLFKRLPQGASGCRQPWR